MPLTYQEVINRGILDQLAAVYREQTNANVLLASVNFQVGRIPPFSDPMNFWSRICELIRDGILPGGFEPLLQAAARSYPGNPAFTFIQATDGHQSQSVGSNGYVNLLVPGDRNPRQLLDLTRRLAQQQNLPQESAILRFANAEGVLISLNGWTIEQALELSENLTSQLSAASQRVRPTVTENRFEDYLISQLFVEGPDQAQYEINDIRASTLVRDVAQGVMSSGYDPKTFSRDAKGRAREVTIDRQNPDGSTERLNPDSTLHDQGIREGDTLSVNPESTAGAVNPIIREEALARVREQVLRYAGSHRGFQVSVNSQYAPTEYLFHFRAPSFAPPAVVGGEPPPIDEHEVFLLLPPNFPMQAPQVFWQSEIFHPNINPRTGLVCLGPLGDHYQPALDFGDLCQMLVDMAGYINYVVEEGYNLEAQQWAVSLEGQVAIERRGGQSMLRKLVHQHHQPRPLRIRRIQQ